MHLRLRTTAAAATTVAPHHGCHGDSVESHVAALERGPLTHPDPDRRVDLYDRWRGHRRDARRTNLPLNQVVLQAPDVAQDSFGQFQCAASTTACSTA